MLRDFAGGRSAVSGGVIFVISAVVLRIILVVVATAGVKIEGIDDDAGNSRIYMGQQIPNPTKRRFRRLARSKDDDDGVGLDGQKYCIRHG